MPDETATKAFSEEVEAKMSSLALNTELKSPPKAATSSSSGPKKVKKPIVADSWEDQDTSSDSDSGVNGAALEPRTPTASGPSAPPPTPLTPSYSGHSRQLSQPSWSDPTHSHEGASSPQPPPQAGAPSSSSRRPEKTDAVARRMIAAGLGLKAPKQTEEQRRKEEADKVKAAMWDD